MRRRATIGDLKKAAAAAFTANYKVFERFEPREMQGIHGEVLPGALPLPAYLFIRKLHEVYGGDSALHTW